MGSFGRSLFHPVPIMTVAASGLTYLFTGFWWLLPLGVVASIVIAAVSREEPEVPAAVPDELAGCSPEHRIKLRPLLLEKAKILEELKRKDENAFLDRDDIASRVDSVVVSYRHLLEKLDELRPLLDERELVSLRRSIDDLERQLTASTDAIAKESLSQAIAHRRDEQGRLSELSRYRERVEAQLLSLASALTNLRVRLVAGRVSQESTLDPATGIKESLDGLFHEIEVAEKTSLELNKIVLEDRGRGARRAPVATRLQ